jgi:hypothetical protein
MNIADTMPEQKIYDRLDRHVRTSASVSELEHWDAVRKEWPLSRAHDRVLTRLIAERIRFLTEGKR